MQLDHEQFEGAKVLAEIGTKIAEGRAVLEQLKSSTDSYLKEREQETIERIKKVLESSATLLTEIGQYHSELEGYRNQVATFVVDIRYLLEGIGSFETLLNETTSAVRGDLDNREAKVGAALEQVRKGRALLAADARDLEAQKQQFGKDKKKLKDEWAALERAAAEIKNKKK